MLLRGGARASPRVTLDRTVGQKRKWKCHVNVFVMQADHVARGRGCLWFMLCQRASLSNSKMGFFFGLRASVRLLLGKHSFPHSGGDMVYREYCCHEDRVSDSLWSSLNVNMLYLRYRVRVWIHYLLFICSCFGIKMWLASQKWLFFLTLEVKGGNWGSQAQPGGQILLSPFFFPPLGYWASNGHWLACLPWNRWLILCHASPAVDCSLPPPLLWHPLGLCSPLCVSHPRSGPDPFRQLDIVVLMAGHTALPGRLTAQHDNSHIAVRVEALSGDDKTRNTL